MVRQFGEQPFQHDRGRKRQLLLLTRRTRLKVFMTSWKRWASIWLVSGGLHQTASRWWPLWFSKPTASELMLWGRWPVWCGHFAGQGGGDQAYDTLAEAERIRRVAAANYEKETEGINHPELKSTYQTALGNHVESLMTCTMVWGI